MNSEVKTKGLLVIGYNRPKNLNFVLHKLRNLDPSMLILISIDGPKGELDINVSKCKEIAFKFAELKPNVLLNFSSHNLGCKYGVSSAISWAFTYCQELMIVEDDLQFDLEGLRFLSRSLDLFKDKKDIWHINGFTPLFHPLHPKTPYVTQHPHVWGWATWKDRWELYDLELRDYPNIDLEQISLLHMLTISEEYQMRFTTLLEMCKMNFDTWDVQWVYTIWKNGGRCVSPPRRFFGNVGFNRNATHTKKFEINSISLLPKRKLKFNFNFDTIEFDKDLDLIHESIAFNIPRRNILKLNVLAKISILINQIYLRIKINFIFLLTQ